MIIRGQTGSYGVMGEHNGSQQSKTKLIGRLKNNEGYIDGEVQGWGNGGACYMRNVKVVTHNGITTHDSYCLHTKEETDEICIYE